LISPARNQERLFSQFVISSPDDPQERAFPKQRLYLKALYIVLLIFIGLTFTSKDGRDRWIYGAFAIATILVLMHYRQIPGLSHWHLRI
jgi:hypothetical protein